MVRRELPAPAVARARCRGARAERVLLGGLAYARLGRRRRVRHAPGPRGRPRRARPRPVVRPTSSGSSARSSTGACPRPSRARARRARSRARWRGRRGRAPTARARRAAVSRSISAKQLAAALRRVDRGDHDRHPAAQLPAACRRAARGRRGSPRCRAARSPPRRRPRAARGSARRRAARLPAPRLLAADHRSFCHRRPGARRVRRGEPRAVALADADALERPGRLAEQRVELGQRAAIASAAPTATTISGTCRFAPREPRAAAAPVRGAVDAEQHARARDAVARAAGRRAATCATAPPRSPAELTVSFDSSPGPAATAAVDARSSVISPSPASAAVVARPRRGSAPGASTAIATSGRSSDSVSSRSVRRWCLTPKPRAAAQQQARAQPAPRVRRHQRVGEDPAAVGVALAEVRRQREQRRASQRRPELAPGPRREQPQHEADARR